MSLLWVTAMPWWNGEEPHEYEEGLRDPEEPLLSRGQRYKAQVMHNHGVDGPTAQHAIQHVVRHLMDDAIYKDPTEYGFASSGRSMDHWDPDVAHRLMDPHTWKGRKPQQVDLTEPIHASQEFIRPPSVAHNLFHPGKRQPSFDDEAVGDPDYDPDEHRYEDDGDYEDPDHQREQNAIHSQVYFMRRNNGRMEVVDGHHRVATNLLLGKESMPGVVIHENEIPRRRR